MCIKNKSVSIKINLLGNSVLYYSVNFKLTKSICDTYTSESGAYRYIEAAWMIYIILKKKKNSNNFSTFITLLIYQARWTPLS